MESQSKNARSVRVLVNVEVHAELPAKRRFTQRRTRVAHLLGADEQVGFQQLRFGIGVVHKPALGQRGCGLGEVCPRVNHVVLDIGGRRHLVGDTGCKAKQIAINLIGERLHSGNNELRGEARNIHRQLLCGDCERYIKELIHFHGNAAFGSILHRNSSGKLLCRKGCGLADGDGIAHTGDKLAGIVAVHQICHNCVVSQHHKGFTGDNVGGKNRICHK